MVQWQQRVCGGLRSSEDSTSRRRAIADYNSNKSLPILTWGKALYAIGMVDEEQDSQTEEQVITVPSMKV